MSHKPNRIDYRIKEHKTTTPYESKVYYFIQRRPENWGQWDTISGYKDYTGNGIGYNYGPMRYYSLEEAQSAVHKLVKRNYIECNTTEEETVIKEYKWNVN